MCVTTPFRRIRGLYGRWRQRTLTDLNRLERTKQTGIAALILLAAPYSRWFRTSPYLSVPIRTVQRAVKMGYRPLFVRMVTDVYGAVGVKQQSLVRCIQTAAWRQMPQKVVKAARTKPLLPLVTVSYRSAAIYTTARVCSVAADAADSQGGNNQSRLRYTTARQAVLPPSTLQPAYAALLPAYAACRMPVMFICRCRSVRIFRPADPVLLFRLRFCRFPPEPDADLLLPVPSFHA